MGSVTDVSHIIHSREFATAKWIFLASPIGIIVLASWAMWLAVIHSPKLFTFMAVFLKTFFILIHSDIRLLCGVDAAIGAGVGYFSGNPIIGALVGGVVGVANYEILSKRVLHLVPRR